MTTIAATGFKYTVQSLRQSGVKVRVHHFRYDRQMKDKFSRLIPIMTFRELHTNHLMDERGGKTEVTITYPDGTNAVGVSECSKKDAFNRKLGVQIALGRALTTAHQLIRNRFNEQVDLTYNWDSKFLTDSNGERMFMVQAILQSEKQE